MKKFGFILLLSVLAVVSFSSVAYARIGVGVANGKITVTEKLKPGIIYNLPPFTVVNTGDVESDYQVAVTYNEKQPQLKPKESWFIFSPKDFHLKPGKVQVVDVKLNLPVSVEPGNYYAYLEAHPLKKAHVGNTSINIAAASKLYFTIVPANIFAAIFYKIASFWTIYSPWPQITLFIVALIVAAFLAKRFLNIQIGVKQKPNESLSRRERLQRNDSHKTDE